MYLFVHYEKHVYFRALFILKSHNEVVFDLIKEIASLIHGTYCLQKHSLLRKVIYEDDDSASHILQRFRTSKKLRMDTCNDSKYSL